MNSNYASLQSRVKSAVVDGVILITALYCTSELLNTYQNAPSSLRMWLFILYFILYEPLMVSIFGHTLGYYYCDIKVRRLRNLNRKISFPLALIRFILKSLLSWLSPLTITSSEKKQAIHDVVVQSVVVYG